MQQNDLQNKETLLNKWVSLLIGLWIFIIPFGRSAQVPAALMAITGVVVLTQQRKSFINTTAAKRFLVLCFLYLIPIAISMLDATYLKYPIRIFEIGIGSVVIGLLLIHCCKNKQTINRIALLIALGIAFWLIYAAGQVIFDKDLFRTEWRGAGDRISGPFTNVNIMGYYAGPYCAVLLVFAVQRKWHFIWKVALFIFTTIIIMLNNSRGGWIMYAIVSAGFIWKAFIAERKHKLIKIALITILGTVGVVGLYYTSPAFKERVDQSLIAFQNNPDEYQNKEEALNEALTERLPVWQASWDIIKEHPINGIGARNFRTIAREHWPEKYILDNIGNTFHPHQIVLEYALGTGIIGVMGLTISAMLCIIWWFKANPAAKMAACGYGLVLLADYFPVNTHRSMYASFEAICIWIIIALYCATISENKTDSIKLSK